MTKTEKVLAQLKFDLEQYSNNQNNVVKAAEAREAIEVIEGLRAEAEEGSRLLRLSGALTLKLMGELMESVQPSKDVERMNWLVEQKNDDRTSLHVIAEKLNGVTFKSLRRSIDAALSQSPTGEPING